MRILRWAALWALALCAIACGRPSEEPWPGEPPSPRVEIVVDFTKAADGRVPVSSTWTGLGQQGVEFSVKGPSREYKISDEKFWDGAGQPIQSVRSGNSIRLTPFEGDVVRASWVAEPGGVGRHGRQGAIEKDWAVFEGRLFLAPSKDLRAARLRFVLPEGWTVAGPFRESAGWHYLDTFSPKDTGTLLQESCLGVGLFEVQTKRIGEMDVRVASYSGWSPDHRARLAKSTLAILEYFHDTLAFDLRAPYAVVWTPRVGNEAVHGGASATGTCLQHPEFQRRPLQLLAHRIGHSMNKYKPRGMSVADPVDQWFREGWASYIEVVATHATGVAPDEGYLNELYERYKRVRGDEPALDVPLSEDGKSSEDDEFLHYTKGPLVAWLLAEQVRARSDRTLEEFMRAMWSEHGSFQSPFDLRKELAAFTGAGYDDFWEAFVLQRGVIVPGWDGFVTDEVRRAAERPPAARIDGEPIPGDYLHYLASSGDFATFAGVRDFVVAEIARRRQLEGLGIRLCPKELRRSLHGIPAEDRYTLARVEASYPVAAGVREPSAGTRFEIERESEDGRVFAGLLEQERGYLAAVSHGPLRGLEVRTTTPGGSEEHACLAFGSEDELTIEPLWRTTPPGAELALVAAGQVLESWKVGTGAPLVSAADDRGEADGRVAARVSLPSLQAIDRPLWQRGRGRMSAERAMAARFATKGPAPDSRDPEAWYRNGVVLSSMGENKEAERSLARATALDPGDAKKWYKLGVVQSALGKAKEALTSFDTALARKPDYYAARTDRVLVLADLGRREECLAALDEVLAEQADDPARFWTKGRALDRLGDLDAALENYKSFVELQPRRAEGWSDMGHTLLRAGRTKEAIEALDQAIRLNPKDDRARRERERAGRKS